MYHSNCPAVYIFLLVYLQSLRLYLSLSLHPSMPVCNPQCLFLPLCISAPSLTSAAPYKLLTSRLARFRIVSSDGFDTRTESRPNLKPDGGRHETNMERHSTNIVQT